MRESKRVVIPGHSGPKERRFNVGDLSELGEFGVIDRLAARMPTPPEALRPLVPIGDDAAVVRCDGPLALATDMLVEGRHFLLDAIDAADLAYKAIAANVSDIAAMGGTPAHVLLSLALSERVGLAWIDRFADGLAEACSAFQVALIGGDTTGGELVVVNIAISGTLPAGRAVTRSGAQPGDLVCVTGALGASAAGLRILLAQREGRLAPGALGESAAALVRAHNRPVPRVAAGVSVARLGASAMIDVSDGLVADLGHIADASGVGIDVDPGAVPVDPRVLAVAEALAIDGEKCALAGGEDYELALTVPPDRLGALAAAIRGEDVALTVIGTVGEGRGVTVAGRPYGGSAGWDHFARG